jgi:hypothetical protein
MTGSNDLTISNLTMFVIGIKPTNKVFIKISSSGTLTLKDCKIEMSEIFYSWTSPGNAWNGTFIEVKNGKIIFENTEFNNIEISESNKFLSSTISDGNLFQITNCIFNNCGCIGNGEMISITSSSSSTSSGTYSSTISKTKFISCFSGGNGGCIYINSISVSINDCEFTNCSSTGNDGKGGISFFFLFLYFYLFQHIK